ncbi:uncharacterized protein LOC120598734 [Pteropus medius]|uniref:uncharacterized protein LOC120598734 n=1 Tax=Pteropus vampyrus TaxID=132908 RepID=UPI00196B9A09|nr:uncharacterized protein LOC120598734 [Pteropus giganteus]
MRGPRDYQPPATWLRTSGVAQPQGADASPVGKREPPRAFALRGTWIGGNPIHPLRHPTIPRSLDPPGLSRLSQEPPVPTLLDASVAGTLAPIMAQLEAAAASREHPSPSPPSCRAPGNQRPPSLQLHGYTGNTAQSSRSQDQSPWTPRDDRVRKTIQSVSCRSSLPMLLVTRRVEVFPTPSDSATPAGCPTPQVDPDSVYVKTAAEPRG